MVSDRLSDDAPEEVILYPDGWLAVARLHPYRVDWRIPDGRWILGEALPLVDGGQESKARRTTGAARGESAPFQRFPLKGAPDGNLLIFRSPIGENQGNRYDLVDRRGRLTARLALANGERLVGVGRRGAYVAAADSDGIQRLRRHPWFQQ